MCYLGRVGLTALVCGSLFNLDLTGLNVALDEQFTSTLGWLGQKADSFRSRVFEAWPGLSLKTVQLLENNGASRGLLQPRQVRRILA